jgi:hypothetical protein
MAPLCSVMPKVRTAQVTRDNTASKSVDDIVRWPRGRSVDGNGTQSYLTSEWASAGSHVIEPTGPMKGPNAVADVMPPGGRQMSW